MANKLMQHLNDFLEELEIGQGRSARTVENYDHYLKRFFEQQGIKKLSDISVNSIRSFRRQLVERFQVSAPTMNYHLIALRQFLKYLAKHDIKALAPDKIGLAKLAERDIDILYPEELDMLLDASKPPADKPKLEDYRDHALLQILFSTGMRISEALSLNRDDLRGSGEIPVRGKGNKVRVVFVSNDAQVATKEYLKKRQDMEPKLFPMSVRTAQRLIKKYAVQAGLSKKITPHTLRHSFATDLLSNGADVRQVQQLLGHASITTTQVYTHLTDVHLKEVHSKFHRKR